MQKLALIIVDGWGVSEKAEYNAFHAANLSFIPQCLDTWPHTLLRADGVYVGLPDGVVGNSEVGHLHLGSGRVIKQPLLLIEDLWKDNYIALRNNRAWQDMIVGLRERKGACHVIGLVSSGHVHGSYDHMLRWMHVLKSHKIESHIHAITDGRDSPQHHGLKMLSKSAIKDHVKTVSGRFYAMDRDKNWLRTLWAAEAILAGDCDEYQVYGDVGLYLQDQYHQDCGDEYVQPAVKQGYEGIRSEDAVLIINFRHDRMRQLLQSLVGDSCNIIGCDFEHFKDHLRSNYRHGNRPASQSIRRCEVSQVFSVVRDRNLSYSGQKFLLDMKKIFHGLGETLSRANLTQLRVAESEKAPHVTWFFNGGNDPWPGEDWSIAPSVKCTTWDQCPRMSAALITEAVLNRSRDYDFILVNYANCDLVGHSGDFVATVMAARTVDEQLAILTNALLKANYKVIITSDHGNAEQMFDSTSKTIHTGHTSNPVHCIFLGWDLSKKMRKGSLIDLAPTILNHYNISVPEEMEGENLFY